MLREFKDNQVVWVIALCALTAVSTTSCAVSTEFEDVETSALALREERSNLPVDQSPQTPPMGKPTNLVKAGKFTKTSPDRVEVLEGTYRTPGSRRILLDMIEESEGDYRSTMIQTYQDVMSTLSDSDARVAQRDLDGVVNSSVQAGASK